MSYKEQRKLKAGYVKQLMESQLITSGDEFRPADCARVIGKSASYCAAFLRELHDEGKLTRREVPHGHAYRRVTPSQLSRPWRTNPDVYKLIEQERLTP